MDDDVLFGFYAGMLIGALVLRLVRQAAYIERLERRVSYSTVVLPRSRTHTHVPHDKESHESAKADSTTE